MQGRKIKHKRTGEVFTFLQFDTRGIYACIVEDSKGDIQNYPYSDMQFVKEEPIKTEDKSQWISNNQQCKQIESCFNSLSKKCICKKSETTGIDMMKHKAESMPTLQNTVEVWACMDRNGIVNISEENTFYKTDNYWINESYLYSSIINKDFKKAFQGVQWEDEAPKRFRITVEPLGNE